ncbi:MAG: GAF domain-containing protein [Thiotrichaceae bacterium]
MSNTITKTLADIPNNLLMLERFYTIDRYMSWREIGEPYKSKKWLSDTTEAFSSICDSISLCTKLQLIDPNGQELLRIEDTNESLLSAENQPPQVAKPENLHNVQGEPYIAGILKNPKESHVVLSELQSKKNIEGKHYPALVYSVAVINTNKELQGVIAFTVDVSFIFKLLNQEMHEESAKSYHYLLLDQAGNYLLNPKKQINFQQERQLEVSLKEEEPELFNMIAEKEQGTLTRNNLMSSFQQIKLLENTNIRWTLVKQTNEDIALVQVERFKQWFVLSIIAVVILVVLIANRFTRMIISPLLQINELLKTLAQGNIIEKEIKYGWYDEVTEIIAAARQLKESLQNTIQQAHAVAQGNYENQIILLSEHDQLGRALLNMMEQLRLMTRKNAAQDWLKTGQAELNKEMSGEQDIPTLSRNILNFICRYLKLQVGVIYLLEEPEHRLSSTQPMLKMVASYGYVRRKNLANQFAVGEGLVGQAALERQAILISQVPDDYIHIQSGWAKPCAHILVLPFMYEDGLKGIIELGGLEAFSDAHLELLKQVVKPSPLRLIPPNHAPKCKNY